MSPPSISVIMPALDEENSLVSSVAAVKYALDALRDYEIIIFNDGSHDRTGRIADDLAVQDPRVRVIHNPSNQGIGYCYKRGVEIARHDYVLMVPGDNETPATTIRAIGERTGQADIIVTYTMNSHIRPIHRRILSCAFTVIMNTLFGLGLRYYNGNSLIRAKVLREISIDTQGFAYMAALLVRLLKQGHSYIEIGINLQKREKGHSKALLLRNFVGVAKSILVLLWETRIRPEAKSRDPASGFRRDRTPRRR